MEVVDLVVEAAEESVAAVVVEDRLFTTIIKNKKILSSNGL